MIRTQISLPQEEYEAAKEEAARLGISLAELLRRALRSALPETDAADPWCDVNTSLLRVTALGSYTVPKIDVLLATTFRSEQGQQLAANYTTGPANTTLGRPFGGVSQTITVNLIEPGSIRLTVIVWLTPPNGRPSVVPAGPVV